MSGDGRIALVIARAVDALPPALLRRRHEVACLALGNGLSEVEAEGWMLIRHVAPAAFGGWSHGTGCICCQGSQPVGAALNRLYIDRVRGLCPHFASVVIVCADMTVTELTTVLQQDALVRARYQI